MARRMPNVNTSHVNGNAPPPSTLAAQIVQNQTRHAGLPKDGETATFAQLLQEILSNANAVQETDVDVNVQLINVVAEAGLAPLPLDNPFAQWDVLVPQARDSIAVIENTLKRQPEVLITQVSEDGPQLLLPLLARLLAVCGRQRCHDIPIPRLIDTAITSLSTSVRLWQSVRPVKRVFREVVDGEYGLAEP